MHWRNFWISICFAVATVIFGVAGWIILPPSCQWFAPVIALIFISAGLGINNLLLINRTLKRIEAIDTALQNMVQTQEAIQREQKEKSDASSLIVPAIQSFLQMYLESPSKQQEESRDK